MGLMQKTVRAVDTLQDMGGNAEKKRAMEKLRAQGQIGGGAISAQAHGPGGFMTVTPEGLPDRRQTQLPYALLGGGGVSKNVYGEATDPNALPLWDPYNTQTGPGTSYLNLLQQPSMPASKSNAVLSQSVLPRIAAGPQERLVPGMENVDASRQMQLGALSGVRGAGADAAAGQAMMPGQISANAMPSLGVTNRLLASSGRLGAGNIRGQDALTKLLQLRATGQGPSAAQAVLQQGLARNVGAMMGVAANARGGAAGGAMRQATLGGQQLGLQTQAQAAQLAAEEQIAAQDQLSQHLFGARGQDVGTFGTVADAANASGDLALRRDLGVAGILGQTRGQDIEQALGAAGVVRDMRGQDLDATGEMLRSRALDDQMYQQDVGNALMLMQQQLNSGQMDADMMLRAAGLINDYVQTRRANDTNRRAVNQEGSQMAWDKGMDVTNTIASGVAGYSSGGASGIAGGVAGGGK